MQMVCDVIAANPTGISPTANIFPPRRYLASGYRARGGKCEPMFLLGKNCFHRGVGVTNREATAFCGGFSIGET